MGHGKRKVWNHWSRISAFEVLVFALVRIQMSSIHENYVVYEHAFTWKVTKTIAAYPNDTIYFRDVNMK